MKRVSLLSATIAVLAGGCEEPVSAPPMQPELGPAADDETGGVDDDDAADDDDDDDDSDGGDGAEPAEDHSDAIDDYIYSLGHVPLPPAAAKAPVQCNAAVNDCPAPWEDDEGRTCTLQYYAETQHIDTFGAMQPESPALWPGAVLRGADVMDGLLSPVGLERAPATLSVSLENLGGSPSATMENPSLSAFREARNEILGGGVNGSTPAQISYEIHTIESRSQLSFHIGASVDWASVLDFDAMFEFGDSEYSNRYLFDFTQTYYTVDLDTPARPSDLFMDHVSVEDLEQFAGPDDPPMYVQSVAYGRRVIFALESNDSLNVIISAVNAAFGDIAEFEANLDAQEALGSAKITAGVIGGDGGAAVRTILGAEQLLEYITSGGNYSAKSPGHPIGYKIGYLDNTPARVALTAEYPEEECQ